MTIYKSKTGFGFNVSLKFSEEGILRKILRRISGELNTPLYYVRDVEELGVADNADLLDGDRIIEM